MQLEILDINDRQRLVGSSDEIDAEVMRLSAPPNINFLRWLPTLYIEVGVRFLEREWHVVKGFREGVPVYLLPEDCSVILHSHYYMPDDDGSIPSPRDFFWAHQHAKNYTVGERGITQYWPVSDLSQKELKRIIYRNEFNDTGDTQRYLQFLNDIDAKFKVTDWEKLDERRLAELLKPF